MHFTRILLAGISGFVAYFVLGGLLSIIPSLRTEFLKFPAIYRPLEVMKRVMPAGMAAMFIAIVALAALYSMLDQSGSGLFRGALFGALVAVFAIGAFVVHNYVNLNIGLKLTMQQAVVYFIEWTVVGVAIGLVYRPAP